MYTSVFIFISCSVLSCGITVKYRKTADIISKTKIPLEPIRVECGLTDMIILSAPLIPGVKAQNRLYNPKGEYRNLNISPPQYGPNISDYDAISVKKIGDIIVVTPAGKYKVFNANFGVSLHNIDSHEKRFPGIKENEFIIGPVSEDDYGNWVVSTYYQDDDNEWVEVYQSITIDIIEDEVWAGIPQSGLPASSINITFEIALGAGSAELFNYQVVPADPAQMTISGGNFTLSFAYPIPDLLSCQLIVPMSTFDRFYERIDIDQSNCGFLLKNTTPYDSGLWKIIGVGRVTYVATCYLNVTGD